MTANSVLKKSLPHVVNRLQQSSSLRHAGRHIGPGEARPVDVITPVMLNGHGIATRRIYLYPSRTAAFAFGLQTSTTTSLPWPKQNQISYLAPGKNREPNDLAGNSAEQSKTDAPARLCT